MSFNAEVCGRETIRRVHEPNKLSKVSRKNASEALVDKPHTARPSASSATSVRFHPGTAHPARCAQLGACGGPPRQPRACDYDGRAVIGQACLDECQRALDARKDAAPARPRVPPDARPQLGQNFAAAKAEPSRQCVSRTAPGSVSGTALAAGFSQRFSMQTPAASAVPLTSTKSCG